MPSLLTPPEVRAALRLSPSAFKRILARGGLKAVRLNARVLRFRREDVERFISTHLA